MAFLMGVFRLHSLKEIQGCVMGNGSVHVRASCLCVCERLRAC
jgi:hypothetical protein